MPDDPVPRPPWRPTDYKPEYCEKVVEWGQAGKSRAWICAELGVVRQTLKNWEAAHPDFLVAMERAKLAEQQWWEDAGQGGMVMPGFGSSVWSRSMAARFPDDWREKSEQDLNLTGKIQVTEIKRTIVDPRDSDA
jgi:hypothetical protein